jgi:uncharacterized membrane protein YfcA
MGGGTLTIPLLVLFFGVEQTVAQTVNLVAFLPTGLLALFIHFKNKLVDVKKAMTILIPALMTTVLSSIFATDLKGEFLTKLFCGVLIVIAVVSFLAQVLKKN